MKADIMQFDYVDLTLRQIITDFEFSSGVELTCTSMLRLHDPGVHGTLPLRGLDFRCHNKAIGMAIAEEINRQWIYDSERPRLKVALYHNTGQGWHLHLQSHSNTTRR